AARHAPSPISVPAANDRPRRGSGRKSLPGRQSRGDGTSRRGGRCGRGTRGRPYPRRRRPSVVSAALFVSPSLDRGEEVLSSLVLGPEIRDELGRILDGTDTLLTEQLLQARLGDSRWFGCHCHLAPPSATA